MTKVDFSQIKFDSKAGQLSHDQWAEQLKANTGKSEADFFASTMENINVKPLYTAEDIKDAEQIGYMPGIAPNLRGPYPTMYSLDGSRRGQYQRL